MRPCISPFETHNANTSYILHITLLYTIQHKQTQYKNDAGMADGTREEGVG